MTDLFGFDPAAHDIAGCPACWRTQRNAGPGHLYRDEVWTIDRLPDGGQQLDGRFHLRREDCRVY